MRLNHHREGTGEPLVLLHGIGHRWQGWLPLLPWLTPQREVIALDLPGFGGSPAPPPETPPGIESLTTLVAEFLEESGVRRPHVVGNSLGGYVALELAKRDLVRSVTGISPAGFHNRLEGIFQRSTMTLTVRGSRVAAPWAKQLTSLLGAARIALFQLAAHPERIPREELIPTITDFAGAPWFDETLAAVNRVPFSGGEQIIVPVTIAWGDRDRLLLPHQARRAGRLIPTARVVRLHGCGHVPMYDDPEQVAKVILDGSQG